MDEVSNGDLLAAAWVDYLRQGATSSRESWSEEDTMVLAHLHAAIVAGRRKGYEEADFHCVLKALLEME